MARLYIVSQNNRLLKLKGGNAGLKTSQLWARLVDDFCRSGLGQKNYVVSSFAHIDTVRYYIPAGAELECNLVAQV